MFYKSCIACIACVSVLFTAGLLVFLSAMQSADAAPLPMPTGDQLTAAVTKLDTGLFTAYNNCDLAAFAGYIAPDIEFYHDKGGLTLGRKKIVESIKNNICGKVRRVLIPGTLEVEPIPGYGALETGDHRFCDLHTKKCEGAASFTQLWKYENGNWLLSRVISYNHHTVASGPVPSPVTK